MADKIMKVFAEESGGKSYKAHKYALDHIEIPSIDYTKQDMTWERVAETNDPKGYVSLKELSDELIKHDTNRLTYFLDGSRRVYKVDDIAYKRGQRTSIYPVVAGQIAVGCCRRVNKHMHHELLFYEWDLAVPNMADKDGKPGFFEAMATKINDKTSIARLPNDDFRFAKVMPYKTDKTDKEKYEDRATARIQDRMIELEKEAVSKLVSKGRLDQDNYLIKDGSLEYRLSRDVRMTAHEKAKYKGNYNWVLGVSKNFNPEICMDMKGKANPGFIAELPLYHRTPVALYEYGGMKYAVWYLRLRDRTKTMTPFDGIVKVEKILVNEDEEIYGIDSAEVDSLSANLINERTPTCYGSDLRWANHIYPVYLTEQWVKSKYISTESFLHLF